MTEYYKHYNCDGNLDEFATFLRPAYGIAIHDLDDIPVTAKDFIKDFVKNVLGKKRYVDKMSRRFMKEGDKYIPTATTIRSKVSPIDATPWESFIELVQRMVKKDLVLQAVAIIKTAEDIHPVVTGLFFFAALVVESVGDKNYLNKMKDVVCLNFKITTGPKSFNDLCKVVDAFVLDQLKTVEETTEVNKKEDVVPSSQNSNAEIGETVLEEPTIVHEIMKAGDKEEIVPPNPVIHHIGVPNGDQTIDSQIPESSSKEESMAFERFLKSANIAFIDKETTVTFESGAALSFTDSGALNTNEVYQWIASGVKTVKFDPTARHSKLLKAIINFGSKLFHMCL
uniref:Uncharacterized protein n=1 Tax=Panagrolaimus davidi TaxID=227884 RepID=A0A914QN23_9BILA